MAAAKSRTKVKRNNGGDAFIRLNIANIEPGICVATSPDVQGLVAEGRSVTEAVQIAQGLARKIVESCLEHGDPLPRVFSRVKATTSDSTRRRRRPDFLKCLKETYGKKFHKVSGADRLAHERTRD